jgi:hypothetical protein
MRRLEGGFFMSYSGGAAARKRSSPHQRISLHEKIASRSKSWLGGCHVISVLTERD